MIAMDNSTSSFSEVQHTFPDAELLQVGGTTCECYRVKLYGKLHFMKRLKPNLRTNPQYVAALQKEFEAGYNLDHPHIVKYLSRGDDFILMEYVDGEQLSDFMSNHPDFFATKAHVDRFLSQLLAAVDCLHQHGIVHLDLKPQNILITRVGHNVKLIDLGFSYTDAYPNTTGRTERYAAPEQYDPHRLPDERTDIYAIGRIIELFPCAHLYNKVIIRCTQTQPKQRYQSIQELLSAIQHKTFSWRPLAAVGVVIALLSVVYLFWPRSEAPHSSDTIISPKMTAPVSENEDEAPIYNQLETQEKTTAEVEATAPNEDQAHSPAKAESFKEKPQQVTADVPTTTLAVSTKESAASPASSKEMTVTELRQKLRSIMQPIYATTLEPLTRKSYVGNEQVYNTQAESFRSQLRDRLHPLGQELVKVGAIEQYTFYKEWSNMEMEYINKAYNLMVQNLEQLSGAEQEN